VSDLHIFQNDCDWVVAESIDDAWAVWCETTGEKREDYDDDRHFWTQLPDDQPLRIWHEDNDPAECGCKALFEQDERERRKPVEDWCALKKLIESQGGTMTVPFPSRVETGRRFDPNGHESNCPKGFDSKTCAEWAAEGRRFLCSTEY
jgi:hypothetical protein